MKLIINNYLRLSKGELSDKQIRIIKRHFTQLLTKDTVDKLWKETNSEILLPPNLNYFLQTFKGDYKIEDQRIAPFIEMPEHSLKPRDHQKDYFKQLKHYNYNVVSAMGTGSGKTLTSIILACRLKTPTIFVASQIDHIQSFQKECKEHLSHGYYVIDSKWDGTIYPIMLVTTKLLMEKPAFVKVLQDHIGLLIADEIHKSVTAESTRDKVLYQFKSKYRVYLSATHEHRYEGFVEKALSPNIVTVEVSEVPIEFVPIRLNIGMLEEMSKQKFSVYRDKIYEALNPELIKTVAWIVGKGRQVLIHNDSNKTQNKVKQGLRKLGVRCEVLNQGASRQEREAMKEAYEKGEVQVIIGGVALEASLSLYKASVGIWTTLASKPNSSTQFYGRLKRWNPEVCDRSKIYIDLSYTNNELYFKKRKEAFSKEINLVPKKTKESKSFEFLSLIGGK